MRPICRSVLLESPRVCRALDKKMASYCHTLGPRLEKAGEDLGKGKREGQEWGRSPSPSIGSLALRLALTA